MGWKLPSIKFPIQNKLTIASSIPKNLKINCKVSKYTIGQYKIFWLLEMQKQKVEEKEKPRKHIGDSKK